MSYFPDYRKETDKLNEVDKALHKGFKIAVECAMRLFDDIEDDALSIEKEIAERLKARLEESLECDEIELVCALFDNADYLPEGTELVDARI